MNILLVNYEFPPIGGGGGHAMECLLREYAKRKGLSVTLLTSKDEGDCLMEYPERNIQIMRIPIHKKDLNHWRSREVLEWLWRAWPYYHRLVMCKWFDCAHAFFGFPSGWLCRRTAKQLPYLISLRGSDVPGNNSALWWRYGVLRPVFKTIWKHASGIVACSEGLRAQAPRFMPGQSIDVIPNGVDTVRFHPAERVGPRMRLLTVSRMAAAKRLPVLLTAVETLIRAGCPVRWTIVNGGGSSEDLKALIHQNYLHHHVTVMDHIPAEQMPEVYHNHDLYISASTQEGMSNAMLEAMASGLPIVTTRCPGADELVRDNGLIVESEGLASAIRYVLCNPQKWGIASRIRAEAFVWSSVADQYIHLYQSIVEERHVREV